MNGSIFAIPDDMTLAEFQKLRTMKDGTMALVTFTESKDAKTKTVTMHFVDGDTLSSSASDAKSAAADMETKKTKRVPPVKEPPVKDEPIDPKGGTRG